MADSTALKSNTRILLLGSGGLMGTALSRAFAGQQLTAFQHQELDITDYVAVEKAFLKTRPQIVINASAMTRVDDCEKFREAAFLINGHAPGSLAALCKQHGAVMVHFSTDFVFSGDSGRPYAEEDPARPVNYYGTTKLEGEKRIVAADAPWLIVRTSWLFGRKGDNFVKKILKRAMAGVRLQAADDQVGAPSYSEDVAAALVHLLRKEARGIIHFTNTGSCSRHEQAVTALRLYGLNNSVEAVKNEDLRNPAQRPHHSVLDIGKYIRTTGQTPRSWQQGMADYIAYLKENEYELRS